MAVFLMAVIVLGYVVIWAIWHFVFRGAGDHMTSERPPSVPHDSGIREPLSSADRSCGASARTGPATTARAAQALARAIDDGEASTGSRTGNDAPAEGCDVPPVSRHSAWSSEDDRQA
jgi:hypothetical protein